MHVCSYDHTGCTPHMPVFPGVPLTHGSVSLLDEFVLADDDPASDPDSIYSRDTDYGSARLPVKQRYAGRRRHCHWDDYTYAWIPDEIRGFRSVWCYWHFTEDRYTRFEFTEGGEEEPLKDRSGEGYVRRTVNRQKGLSPRNGMDGLGDTRFVPYVKSSTKRDRNVPRKYIPNTKSSDVSYLERSEYAWVESDCRLFFWPRAEGDTSTTEPGPSGLGKTDSVQV